MLIAEALSMDRKEIGTYMHILYMILIGLVIGIVAKFLMPGRDPGGFVITALLGIGGAVAASYIGQAVGWYNYGQAAGFIAAVLGAMLLLLIYRLATGGHHRSHV